MAAAGVGGIGRFQLVMSNFGVPVGDGASLVSRRAAADTWTSGCTEPAFAAAVGLVTLVILVSFFRMVMVRCLPLLGSTALPLGDDRRLQPVRATATDRGFVLLRMPLAPPRGSMTPI